MLAVGNYMNAGNWRVAGAQGFRIHFLSEVRSHACTGVVAAALFFPIHLLLNCLSQLKELRTTDKKSSLLHFLVNTAERKFPQAIEFLEELTVIKRAARGMESLRFRQNPVYHSPLHLTVAIQYGGLECH